MHISRSECTLLRLFKCFHSRVTKIMDTNKILLFNGFLLWDDDLLQCYVNLKFLAPHNIQVQCMRTTI